MTKLPPHIENVKGDFYVEDGCCTACDLPRTEAPEFFRFDDNYHCYLCKQPRNNSDVIKILNAMEVQDLDCIQYKGKDKDIIQHLKKSNLTNCISSKYQVFWAILKSKFV